MPTPTPELPALDLRLRDAEWIDRPETLAEFARPAPVRDPYAGVAELLLADMVARAQTELAALLDGRTLVSCEHPRFGIPVGVHDPAAPPDLADWHIRERVDVELLDAGPSGRLERSLAAQFRRGLIAVAGALPLLVSPMLAHAGAPPSHATDLSRELGDPLARALQASAPPPSLPAEPTAPAPQQPSAPAQPSAPQPSATAAPAVAPTPAPAPTAPPAPRIGDDALTLTGTSVWAGMLGMRVSLVVGDGQTLEGVLVAQSSTELAIARSSDGTVVGVPKAEVTGVRLLVGRRLDPRDPFGSGSDVPVTQRPTDDGMKLYGGGAAMIGIGSTAALAGTVMLGIYISALYISLPLLLPGLAMIGGGASMMSSAAKKRAAVNRAWGIPTASRLQMVPTLAASRNGGQVGMVMRF